LHHIANISIWPILSGLGLFLFGMFILEESLKNLAGRSFKLFLRKNTNTTFKAIISGAAVTAVLQSSTMVVLLVMSFAGAGILGISNGIGIVLGANLGTTATGWLVALVGFKLNIETLIMPLIALGGLSLMFSKSENILNASKLLIGFSLMFLGLDYMKNSFSIISTQINFDFLQGKSMVLFFAFGFVFTALIQSSSASMSIYLSALAAGIISLPQAVFLIIGSDLGTTTTALIGTINGNAVRKKIGYSQFFFNLYSALLAMLMANAYLYVIKHWLKNEDPMTSLVLFHSMFNLVGIVLFIPWLKTFIKILEKYVKPDAINQVKFINLTDTPEAISGIEALEKETKCFVAEVVQFNIDFFEKEQSQNEVLSHYFKIKQYENEITSFYVSLQHLQLTQQEAIHSNNLIESIRNASLAAKDLKDIRHNMDEFYSSLLNNIELLHEQMIKNQKIFYIQIKYLLNNTQLVSNEELETLTSEQKLFFKNETDLLYKINLSDDNSFDRSSILNLLHEISRSNEHLTKSLKHN
jgi:phosphate:Na+ symporter